MESILKLPDKKYGLSRNAIKYIVIIAMFLDHTAHYLGPANPVYFIFKACGRIVAPVMSFFLVEGYFHTSDVKKYLARLFIFALISYFPYALMSHGNISPVRVFDGHMSGNVPLIYISSVNKTINIRETSVIYTFFLALLSVCVWDRLKTNAVIKVILTVIIIWLSCFGDWGYYIILWCLSIYFFRNNELLKWLSFALVCVACIFQLKFFSNPFDPEISVFFLPIMSWTLLSIPLLKFFYNGAPGRKNSFNKWFFYVFYPLHIFLLHLIFNFSV